MENNKIFTKYVLKDLNLNKLTFLDNNNIKNNYILFNDLTTFDNKSTLNITSIIPKKTIKIFNKISKQYKI